MSNFTGPFPVTIHPLLQRNGLGLATTLAPIEYHVGSYPSEDVVNVPTGFTTDFTSVPWVLRWLVAPLSRSSKAAVVHDYLCDAYTAGDRSRTRLEIDGIFREALGVLKVSWLYRWGMYIAVRTQAILHGYR